MALPVTLSNAGNPVVDATQLMQNFNWLDSGKVREGTVTGVLCDGTVTTVSFSSAFPTSVGVVVATAANYNGPNNNAITCTIVGNPTLSGFQVMCGGGDAGKTITLHYRASGT